jgi:exonuclease SbcD
VDGDGVRELYVGSLARVGADVFPQSIDYVALGHLHVPQAVAGREAVRYSGSPLPMGFGEAGQQEAVLLVELEHGPPKVSPVQVPRFQELARLQGGLQDIFKRIEELKTAGSRAWLELIYDGAEIVADLGAQLEAAVAGSRLEILRIKNARAVERVLTSVESGDTLEQLDVHEVFNRCMDTFAVPEAQQPELLDTYGRALSALYEEDPRAE